MTGQKTKNSEITPEQVKTEMVVEQINNLLKENGLTIQPTLEGYPFILRPAVRIVPIPEKVAEVKDDKEESNA